MGYLTFYTAILSELWGPELNKCQRQIYVEPSAMIVNYFNSSQILQLESSSK